MGEPSGGAGITADVSDAASKGRCGRWRRCAARFIAPRCRSRLSRRIAHLVVDLHPKLLRCMDLSGRASTASHTPVQSSSSDKIGQLWIAQKHNHGKVQRPKIRRCGTHSR